MNHDDYDRGNCPTCHIAAGCLMLLIIPCIVLGLIIGALMVASHG